MNPTQQRACVTIEEIDPELTTKAKAQKACCRKGTKRLPSHKKPYEFKKPFKPVAMYADIRHHNAAHPIESGWRGRPCMGGKAAGLNAMKMSGGTR